MTTWKQERPAWCPYKVTICRGVPTQGMEWPSRSFTVQADNIIAAQVRVLFRVCALTGSTMYFIRSAEKIQVDERRETRREEIK